MRETPRAKPQQIGDYINLCDLDVTPAYYKNATQQRKAVKIIAYAHTTVSVITVALPLLSFRRTSLPGLVD